MLRYLEYAKLKFQGYEKKILREKFERNVVFPPENFEIIS